MAGSAQQQWTQAQRGGEGGKFGQRWRKLRIFLKCCIKWLCSPAHMRLTLRTSSNSTWEDLHQQSEEGQLKCWWKGSAEAPGTLGYQFNSHLVIAIPPVHNTVGFAHEQKKSTENLQLRASKCIWRLVYDHSSTHRREKELHCPDLEGKFQLRFPTPTK